MLFCFYYLVIFCYIYCKTQIIIIKLYFISLAEGIIMKIIFVLLISFNRKLGIIFKKEYIYNTSKCIDKYL